MNVGLAGIEVYDLLRDEYDIQIEFGDLGNFLAYLSIGDRPREVERLVSALAEVRRRFGKPDAAGADAPGVHRPRGGCSPPRTPFTRKREPARCAEIRRARVQRVCHVLPAGHSRFWPRASGSPPEIVRLHPVCQGKGLLA